ncbi:hypothetical protein [Nonomuraea sp. NPDC049141]|uniref:hypothetical protein n=1 Tax=unclassified Nonomuraea TaxID=2593643 RepID=UPI003405BC89
MTATHEMVMVGVSDSGTEEWLCPECGRRTLMRWQPDYEKVVLDVGDELATHFGGRGGAHMPTGKVNPEVQERDVEWLRRHGIDWYGQPS